MQYPYFLGMSVFTSKTLLSKNKQTKNRMQSFPHATMETLIFKISNFTAATHQIKFGHGQQNPGKGLVKTKTYTNILAAGDGCD